MPESRKIMRRGIQVGQIFTPTVKDIAQAQNKKDMKELIDELKAQNEKTQELYEKMTTKVEEAEKLYNILVLLERILNNANHSGQHPDEN